LKQIQGIILIAAMKAYPLTNSESKSERINVESHTLKKIESDQYQPFKNQLGHADASPEANDMVSFIHINSIQFNGLEG
jgi:hypothetical protein